MTIGSDNGLLPGRPWAIIWTNVGILLIEHLKTNFSEILIEIQTFSFKEKALQNVICKMTAILSWPQCVKAVTLVALEDSSKGQAAGMLCFPLPVEWT